MVEDEFKEYAEAVFFENKDNWRFHTELWFFTVLAFFIGIVKLIFNTISSKIMHKK